MSESGLNHPIRTAPVPDGHPTWKDNAYLCFWDPEHGVFGVVHVSVSPNAPASRRLRCSLSIDGRVTETIEDPVDGTAFRGPSIGYPLDDTVAVRTPEVELDLVVAGGSAIADYTAGQVITPLVADEPQHHLQQPVRVSGRLRLADGGERTIDGDGFRDRTWGYREESALVEYVSFMAVLPGFAFTALRFLGDGTDVTDGFVLRSDAPAERVTGIGVVRDGAALLHGAEITTSDGPDIDLTVTSKLGGFWVPMGEVRRGPSFSAYDELCAIRTEDGDDGYAFVEHGVLRRLS